MATGSIEEYFENSGDLSVIGNNKPLLLQGSKNVWFVKSGSVDVFSILHDCTEIKGARIYLFTVNAGNLLFGLDYEHPGRSFLAVGNTNVHIYKLNIKQLQCFVEDSASQLHYSGLIDKWIQSLSGGVAREVSLRYDSAIEKSGNYIVEVNKKIRSRKGVLWLRISSGQIMMLDSEIAAFEGTKYFPLTDNSWCMSIQGFSSEGLSTAELIQNEEFQNYLDFYHTQVLLLEELNVRMLAVDDYVRNESKIKTLDDIEKSAWENIAGVLDPSFSDSDEPKYDNSLVESCRILANYLGIKISVPLGDEKKLLSLADIARSSKFQFRRLTIDSDLSTDAGPLLVMTKNNIPAVLLPDISGKYRVIIPSEKIDSKLTPEIKVRLGKEAYTFYKPFPFKEISPVELLKFVFTSSKKEIGLLAAAGSAGGLLTLFIPLLTGIIIDSVIPQSDTLRLYGFGLAIIFSVFAIMLAQIIRSISYVRLDTKIEYLVMSAVWDRLLNLPVNFFKRFSSGELSSKANSLAYLKQMLTYSVINSIIYNLFLIFNLFLLFYYDTVLGLFSILLFSVYLFIVFTAGSKIKKRNHKVIQLENRITSLVNQMLNSISKLRIAGVERLAFKLWTDKYSVKQKTNIQVRRASNLIIIINSVFPVIAIVMIYALFTMDTYRNFSAGILISFITAFNVFLVSVVQMSAAAVGFFMAAPLYDNTREILYTLPEYAEKKENINDLRGEIELSHVYFRYSKEGEYILTDISMNIKPGEFIAIVGASGSGKSTLMRLLLGFETPEPGAVYYDRHDIESIDKSGLRKQIGTVMQNSKLFPGNIYSNIAGVSSLSVSEVTDIARVVGLDEDLKSMPMGVYTFINEGISTLSGGQRQKILLAKAIAMKPSVLLLDEATSALDNESQNIIAENLARIQATRVIVAHRLSTIKNADRIYVLEKGRIVECGNYEELFSKEGIFKELVKRQLAE